MKKQDNCMRTTLTLMVAGAALLALASAAPAQMRQPALKQIRVPRH